MELTQSGGTTAKAKAICFSERCSSFSRYEVAAILNVSFDLVTSSRQSVLE